MKSKVLGMFLAFSVFFMSQLMTSQKADAAIGLIIKNRTVTTIGGITTGTTAVTYGLAAAGAFSLNLASAILLATSIVTFGAIGLIVLDDKSVADMSFVELNLDSEIAQNFTLDEVLMYNAEIEELNAIRKTMQADLGETGKLEESKKMWSEYKDMLHPSTVKIAEFMANTFVKNLKKVEN